MNNSQEEPNWVKIGGRIFEFVKAIADSVKEMGGDSRHLGRVLKEPFLAQEFAEVLVGRSKIVREDPYEVIKTTGRTYEVKALAAGDIESEEELVRVLRSFRYKIIAEVVVPKISSKRLLQWYNELSPDVKAYWHMNHGELLKLVFEHMKDSELIQIALIFDQGALKATEHLRSQAMLKKVMEKADQGMCRCYAISRIDDLGYLEKHLKKALEKDPHRNKNWCNDLWKRVEELRRQKQLAADCFSS